MPLLRAGAYPHQRSGHSVYYKGKSKEEAYKEMKYYGFNDGWWMAGLKGYFEKHSHQPVSQYIPHSAAHPVQAAQEGGEAGEPQDID